jgi:hypothetical protein
MMIVVIAWLLLGAMNYTKFFLEDPPRSLKEILADIFLILPANLLFGAVITIAGLFK